MATNGKDDDDIPPPQRPPSPPLHTTYAARAIHTPNFSAFRPRDIKIPSPYTMSHVAWSCDGRKLAAVGIDKIVRVWQPEKSMEIRVASIFSGAHADDVDHVSWNPTHPELFVSSSQKDRKIVFWDARQTRSTQQLSLKLTPTQTGYAPDGKTIFYVTAGHSLYFLELGRNPGEAKDSWRMAEEGRTVVASSALFNHAGDGIVASFHSEHTLRVFDYPALTIQENPAAHVGGCIAIAQDPRGKYIASGGHDSIVNLFDVTEWICARTITCCDHAINALSFSHDGEYLAISNTSTYIDICAVETGVPIHRVPTSGPVSTVTWHPSKHLIAFCGQTKVREGSQTPPTALSVEWREAILPEILAPLLENLGFQNYS